MMNSKQFLKVIENMLSKKATINTPPPKLYVFVISQEFPLFFKIFNVHFYHKLWFQEYTRFKKIN